MGPSPGESASPSACTMPGQWPWCRRSAKRAAVTSPPQPAPIPPGGSRRATRAAPLERLGGAGDVDHLLIAERLWQRVRDPVGAAARPPRDQPDALGVTEDHVLLTVELLDARGAPEDRRSLPVRGPGC